jgi:hypothetical protein
VITVRSSLALAALAIALPLAEDASACASIGRGAPIRIYGEEALIVWDPAHHKEHFVRMAGFDPADEDFGFVVPTPSRPELGEADDHVFERLFGVYQRRSRERSAPALGARQAVEVLERRTVAGLDTAVLRADDAGALDRWLEANRYPSSEALRAWLAPYVEQHWFVTAFRIDPSAHHGRGFATRAVRMSFDTDAPFFPYSEPAQTEARRGRPFRVSLVAPARMRVRSGNDAWHGRVGYARQPGAQLTRTLRDVVPADSFGEQAWLTVFDEARSLRGTRDLYFESDEQQTPTASSIDTPFAPYPIARRAPRDTWPPEVIPSPPPGPRDVLDPWH